MAIVRNNSIMRVVMLLCFSTALLSLSLKWYTSNSMNPAISNQTKNTDKNLTKPLAVSNKLPGLLQIPNKSVTQPIESNSGTTNLKQTSQSNVVRNQNYVVVDLSDRRVYVYHTDQVIASYPTGIGKKGWETPVGKFNVMHKELHPAWRHPITGKVFPPGPDSPLGDRWIGFMSVSADKGEIGFHGTPDESLVGDSVSHGCLRMRNADVRMLFEQVSTGTSVEVRS
ncbi:L,D-transpeptidase [Calothrix sp. PCC 6303]|uniref:L,D-transpeptidase n=1 Tax=Calothrix sp. PCC 6303 TaxID=1170562 RepID=UPI0002A04A4A|nr:L,D-transpeptidase [Calothrix sp. PCC 6303]AFY99525.1 ErfK/YbiS/YcfS/YnhG family protein [Calothrix sp. PCC 6303]